MKGYNVNADPTEPRPPAPPKPGATPCCLCGIRGERLSGPLNEDGRCPVCESVYGKTWSSPDTGMKLNSNKTVAVSTEVYWIEDMTSCPRGVKVQLLGAGGVAQYGTYDGKNPFWKKWQSVPRNRAV